MRGPVGAAVLLLLTACSSSAPPPPGPAPRLAADAFQYRGDADRRLMQVALVNEHDDAPVFVRTVALAAGSFAGLPPTATDARLPPGGRTEFPVPYGATRCDGPPPGAPAALVALRTADGAEHELRLDVAAGADDLERMRARDCAQQEVAGVVRLALADWELDEPGQVARARLVLRRAEGADPVTVDGFGGNILFTPRQTGAATTPLGSLPAGAQEAGVAFEIRATRCDPHALIESRRHHLFGFFVTAGAGASVLVTVAADEPDRALLQRLAAITCRPR